MAVLLREFRIREKRALTGEVPLVS